MIEKNLYIVETVPKTMKDFIKYLLQENSFVLPQGTIVILTSRQ